MRPELGTEAERRLISPLPSPKRSYCCLMAEGWYESLRRRQTGTIPTVGEALISSRVHPQTRCSMAGKLHGVLRRHIT